LFKKSFNFCGQFWNDFNLCNLATRQGSLSEAWDYCRSMERNSRQLALPLQQAMTLIVEALLSAMEQVPEKTTRNLSKAKALLERSQQRMSVFHGRILAIKAYETIGRRGVAEEILLKNISPDEPKNYYAAIHFELSWFLPFVERVMQKHPEQRSVWNEVIRHLSPYGTTKIGNTHPRVATHKPRSTVGEVDLHFCSLGTFRVTANGWPVPLERCASKRALTLLRYLFFKRNEGGVLLDEAMELLWPETDPTTSRSYLRVALSMLRKVFRKEGEASEGFPNLCRDGNKLMLSLGKKGWSDVDELMSQVKLAGYKEKKDLWSEALKHYEKIQELYRGDFLSEELYADWCAMEREYLKDQYTTSLMRMVHCHEELGNLADAISILYRVLKADKYREDAYQKLMALCARSGRKGEMLRAYTLCKKAIEEDLNMELSSDTTALYARFCRQLGYQRERTGPMISLVQ
jgi:DNA-binding SARP family transcriptional activator